MSTEVRGTIVLSGPRTETGGMSPDTVNRLDVGYRRWQETGQPLILVGRSNRLMFDALGLRPESPPEDQIHLEPKSGETVGNAIYTKTDILQPKGFTAADLVTATYHMRRANYIFDTVMGSDFDINPLPAANAYGAVALGKLWAKEKAFTVIAGIALRGYDPKSPSADQQVMARMRHIARVRYDG